MILHNQWSVTWSLWVSLPRISAGTWLPKNCTDLTSSANDALKQSLMNSDAGSLLICCWTIHDSMMESQFDAGCVMMSILLIKSGWSFLIFTAHWRTLHFDPFWCVVILSPTWNTTSLMYLPSSSTWSKDACDPGKINNPFSTDPTGCPSPVMLLTLCLASYVILHFSTAESVLVVLLPDSNFWWPSGKTSPMIWASWWPSSWNFFLINCDATSISSLIWLILFLSWWLWPASSCSLKIILDGNAFAQRGIWSLMLMLRCCLCLMTADGDATMFADSSSDSDAAPNSHSLWSIPCHVSWALIFSSCWLISADCSLVYDLAPIQLIKLLPYCFLYDFDFSNFMILSWLILASCSHAFTDSGCWFGCWALIRHCSALILIKDSISLITSSLEMECPADLSLCNQSLSWLIWGWNSLFLPPPDALWCLLSFFLLIFPLLANWCFWTRCFHSSFLAMMSFSLSELMPSFFASDGQNFLSPWSWSNPSSIFLLMSSTIFSFWKAVNSFFLDSSKWPFLFDLLPPANPLSSTLAVADGLPPIFPNSFQLIVFFWTSDFSSSLSRIWSSNFSWSCLRTFISFDSCTLLLNWGFGITLFDVDGGDLRNVCNDACFFLLLTAPVVSEDAGDSADDALRLWTKEFWSSDPVLLILSSGVLKSSDVCDLILLFCLDASSLIFFASSSAFLMISSLNFSAAAMMAWAWSSSIGQWVDDASIEAANDGDDGDDDDDDDDDECFPDIEFWFREMNWNEKMNSIQFDSICWSTWCWLLIFKCFAKKKWFNSFLNDSFPLFGSWWFSWNSKMFLIFSF